MRVIQFQPSSKPIGVIDLVPILQHRLGDGYQVDTADSRMFQIGRNVSSKSGDFFATVQTNFLFRINIRILNRDGLYLSFAPDIAPDLLFRLIFYCTFSLGYWPLMLSAWLFTRRLQRKVVSTLVDCDVSDGRESLAGLTGPDGGEPRVYTGHKARQLAYPVFTTICDIGFVALGAGLLVGILGWVTPHMCRMIDSHYLIVVDFMFAAVGCGMGAAWLLGGIFGLIGRPLRLRTVCGVLLVISLIYAGLVSTIGSPLYWTVKESAAWKGVQEHGWIPKSSWVSHGYTGIPYQYWRTEAWELRIDELEKLYIDDQKRNRDSSIDEPTGEMLKALDQFYSGNQELSDVRARIKALHQKTARSRESVPQPQRTEDNQAPKR